MKTRFLKSILALAMMAMALPMMGQDYVNVNLKNGEINKFLLDNMTKIFTSKTDAQGNQFSDYQFQYVVTADGENVYVLDDIESLTFVKSDEPVIPDGPEAIDLGLPSGTKWASYNVGATKPEEYGGFFAWGETEEKETYTWKNYIHCDGTSITCHDLGSNISGTEYDVAHVKWGGNWCMPTEKDYYELLDNCTEEWTTLNGVNGRKFTSKINGNSIFFPAAGYSSYEDLYYAGEEGYYWSSTQSHNSDYAMYFWCFSGWSGCYDGIFRYIGQSVRPVEKPKANDVPAEAIDLGLPSCTKWASCNVGASKPEEYGGYYAWGETEEKETYTWETYIYCNGSWETCYDLGNDISGTEYDVAHVKWGDKWCMPTENDIKELRNYCTIEWTTINGVNGEKFTSKINGNSIFLPAAGYSWNGNLNDVGEGYGYWTSTPYYSWDANYYGLSSGQRYLLSSRSSGNSVRPVMHFMPLKLSTQPSLVKIGEEAILEITSGNGSYTAESDDESVAMVRVNDNSTLTITGNTLGVAKITVTDNISGRTAIVYALVTKNGLPDDLVDLLPDYFSTTWHGFIPEGWFALFGTEERPSQTSYGSGTRMFDFASGGDFTKGIYFREGYVEYGSTEGYPLTLESGKGYLFNFTTAMWKDNGTNTRFEIINSAGEVVFVQVVDNSPDLKGRTDAVYGASKHSFAFKPDVSGNYVIRWTSSGYETGAPDYMEIILANPQVKYVPTE